MEFRHGTVQTYEVTYQKIKVGDIDMEEEPVMRVTVEVGKTTVLLENLEPYVEYKISVAARTAKGVGPSAFVSGGMKLIVISLSTDVREPRTATES